MRYNLEDLRGDIFGSIVSAVVALPLALAFCIRNRPRLIREQHDD